jgi:hypothetical protein
MKLKFIRIWFVITMVGTVTIIGFSQNSNIKPEIDDKSIPRILDSVYRTGAVKGKVKNKPVYLPIPSYPHNAMSADVDGDVRVQVTIDETGNVSAAQALSGDRLLKTVCEAAALQAKFRIFRENDKPTTTSGELVYHFEIVPANWILIGYKVGGLLRGDQVRFFPARSVAKALGADWADSQELIQQIAKLKREDLVNNVDQRAEEGLRIRTTTIKSPDGFMRSQMTVERRAGPTVPASPQLAAITDQIIASLRKRLANDEIKRWQFELGILLSQGAYFDPNEKARSQTAQDLRILITNVSDGKSIGIKQEISKVIRFLEQHMTTIENDVALYRTVARIVVSDGSN